MDHWPQLCLLRDAEGQRVLGMGMDDGHNIRPRRENRGMNEALEIKAAVLVSRRLTLEVELDNIFGTHQIGSKRAGNQKPVGIVRVADADMAVGVDHLLAGEDPIGDHEILDQSIKTAHCVNLRFSRKKPAPNHEQRSAEVGGWQPSDRKTLSNSDRDIAQASVRRTHWRARYRNLQNNGKNASVRRRAGWGLIGRSVIISL